MWALRQWTLPTCPRRRQSIASIKGTYCGSPNLFRLVQSATIVLATSLVSVSACWPSDLNRILMKSRNHFFCWTSKEVGRCRLSSNVSILLCTSLLSSQKLLLRRRRSESQIIPRRAKLVAKKAEMSALLSVSLLLCSDLALSHQCKAWKRLFRLLNQVLSSVFVHLRLEKCVAYYENDNDVQYVGVPQQHRSL